MPIAEPLILFIIKHIRPYVYCHAYHCAYFVHMRINFYDYTYYDQMLLLWLLACASLALAFLWWLCGFTIFWFLSIDSLVFFYEVCGFLLFLKMSDRLMPTNWGQRIEANELRRTNLLAIWLCVLCIWLRIRSFSILHNVCYAQSHILPVIVLVILAYYHNMRANITGL